MRWFVVLLGLLAGCLSPVRLGQPLTELPTSLAWCGPNRKTVEAHDQPPNQADGLYPAKLFSGCSKILLQEAWHLESTQRSWSWRGEFGLTSNEHGRLTSVCVWGATFGNPTRYMECVADVMMQAEVLLPPGLDKQSYFVSFVSSD